LNNWGRLVKLTRSLAAIIVLGLVLLAAWKVIPQFERRLLTAQSRGRISFHPCAALNVSETELCATYEVYEDRARKVGRKIALNIVLLPASNRAHAPDPVFWFSGGPGGAATQDIGLARAGLLSGVRRDRDIVFVDQRGTGNSNGLHCDILDDHTDLQSFFGVLFPPDRVRACRESLEKFADLSLYTTPIAMDDLDELRDALGYEKINVAGASYGTIAAQVYLRQHPEHVRTVFLAGVANPAIRQPLLFPKAAQNALEHLYADCTADESCSRTFPSLQKEFDTVLARFDKGPVTAELPNPATRQSETVQMSRASIVEHLRLLLYTTNGARFVPAIIHGAYENNYQALEGAAMRLSPGGGIARGMYMTVTCSEGVPFITEAQIVSEARGTFVGEERVRAHIEACKLWPRGKIANDYIDLVKSDVPVLMISGEADGATPPWFAEAALKNYPNGRQVNVSHYGHQLDGPCVASIFVTFIERGSAKDLDASCAAQVRRPPFATEIPSQFLPR
jgi:pimeloyl-ACP methyl ester carboxylesterase